MAADFPTSVKTFTNKTNNVDTIDASHVNDLQDEVNAVETLLGAASLRRTSWTPSFQWATVGTSTWSYGAVRTGYYAKFGSLVYAHGYIVGTPTIGTGSGQLYITGLPRNALNATQSYFPISISNCSGFTAYPTNGLLYSNSDVIRLYRSSNVADTLTTAHVTGGSAITVIFSLFYWDV